MWTVHCYRPTLLNSPTGHSWGCVCCRRGGPCRPRHLEPAQRVSPGPPSLQHSPPRAEACPPDCCPGGAGQREVRPGDEGRGRPDSGASSLSSRGLGWAGGGGGGPAGRVEQRGRGCGHRALELPADAAGVEGGPGPRHGQHSRPQAGHIHQAGPGLYQPL